MTTAGPLAALLGLFVVLSRRPPVVLTDAAFSQAFALAALAVVALVARALSVPSPGLLALSGVLIVAIALSLVLARSSAATGLLVAVRLLATGVSPGLLAAVLALQSVRVLAVLLLTAVRTV